MDRVVENLGRGLPQAPTDYAGLKKSLHQEWEFVQHVIPGIGDAFVPVDEALQEIFLTALFQGLGEGTPERGVTGLHVTQSGLALPYPMNTSPENWTAPCVIIGHLVAALRGQEEFRTSDHSAFLQEGRTALQKQSALLVEEALVETLSGPLV